MPESLPPSTTKTNKIGVIISASDTNWYEMTGGFAAGAHSVNPKLTIEFGQIGPAVVRRSAGGKRVATSMIASGADVIFAMGDDASFGYLQAIGTAKASHKVWYIGDIGDMTPIDNKHVLLSSVLWNFTRRVQAGVPGHQERHLRHAGLQPDAENGGISLLHSKYISAPVWSGSPPPRRASNRARSRSRSTTKASQAQALLKGQ